MKQVARVILEAVDPPGERFAASLVGDTLLRFDNQASPEAASPVQSLLGALGSCSGIDVIMILRKKRQRVTGYEVLVEGLRREEHPRIFTHIEVIHRLRGVDLDPAAIADAIRLSDTKYCTVHAMLEGAAEITSRFEILPDP